MKTLQDIFDSVSRVGLFSGAPIDSVHVSRRTGETPLHIVANLGDAEAIAILVEHGADLNKHAEDGFTSLHFAAEQGRLDAVKCLVQLGAKNSTDNFGNTAKQLANVVGHDAICHFLSEHGY